MAHLVITIGCEYGAKGNQIGRRVAEDLGIKFYDRETVDEIIKEVGIPKDIMEKVEQGCRVPSRLTSMSGMRSTVSYVVNRLKHLRHSRRRRMLVPSSVGRESTTLLSSWPQNGHFIRLHPFMIQ